MTPFLAHLGLPIYTIQTYTIRIEELLMNHQEVEMQQQGDSLADAVAAIVLIAVFVTTCVFWVSGQ
jgi:hypothetical protein